MAGTETPGQARRRRLAEHPHLQVGELQVTDVPAAHGIMAHKDYIATTACGEQIAVTLVTRDAWRARCGRCLKATAERMTPAARDARIITAQNELFGHDGHVRMHLPPVLRQGLAREINALRAANGWEPLDWSRRT